MTRQEQHGWLIVASPFVAMQWRCTLIHNEIDEDEWRRRIGIHVGAAPNTLRLSIDLILSHTRATDCVGIIVKEEACGYGKPAETGEPERSITGDSENLPELLRRSRSGGRAGTATGTPGDYWTTFALVPDILQMSRDSPFALLQPDRVLKPTLPRACDFA